MKKSIAISEITYTRLVSLKLCKNDPFDDVLTRLLDSTEYKPD
jgi:predicted CopG family antitoxin